MKILLFQEMSCCTSFLASVAYNHFYRWLIEPMLKDGQDVEVKTLLPESAYWHNQKHHNLDNLNIIPVFDNEYLDLFSENLTFGEIEKKIYENDLSIEEKNNYKNLIFKKTGSDWKPDIIISHMPPELSGVAILSDIFPDALAMGTDNGVFSRPPFMRSLFYAPYSPTGPFMFRYKEEINDFKLSVKQNEIIEELKQSIVKIVDANTPDQYKEFSKNIRNKFDKVVLLPMYIQRPSREDNVLCFKRVMEKIPKNIGVIFTSHDDLGYDDLNLKIRMYYQQSYKNLFYYFEEDNLFKSSSLPFFHQVDAVINNNTLTGLQACIWGKKIISMESPNNSAYFSDKIGLDNIEDFLDTTARNKNRMLYWYLTHYIILEKRLNDGKWLFKYFQEKLEHFKKNGITFDFYGQNEDISELSQYILNYIKDYYRNSSKPIKNKYQIQIENLMVELNQAKVELNQAKEDKYKHLPKSIGLFLSCFIAKKKNRSQFRKKYVKGF
ncbi:MAG: hypothetical protein LBD17_01120 [Endomicrobium sp.]|jgi:hypothetical protein|nr:hypothetical protein [Endomicrobium sp.]